MSDQPRRRDYLKAAGSVAALGVAGCNTGGGNTTPTQGTTEQTGGNAGGEPPVQEVQLPEAKPEQTQAPQGWPTKWSEKLNIDVLATFDSSGEAVWDKSKHPHVYVTTNGPGYAGRPSDVQNPGVALLDADTHEVIATRQYKFDFTPFETHGSAASPDGQWLYIPTGNAGGKMQTAGRLLVINAETLKLHMVLQTSSLPHHIKTFERYDGKPVVLAYTFNWQIPSYPAMGPGSGHWIMDPNDDHKIIGGFRSGDVQQNPYLSFPHPDGRHLYVGMPPGPIGDPDISHHRKGWWGVIDMKNWEPMDYLAGGYDPIWAEFDAKGEYAYLSDGGSSAIRKIDCKTGEEVGHCRASVHGPYGCRLNAKENKLYTVGKGEASHNLGKVFGLVNPKAMSPVNQFTYECLRGDHALINPWNSNEIWVSCNANQRDVVWNAKEDQLKTIIEKSGSSHNGAFVDYSADGDWKVQFDQAGWHGAAKQNHRQKLGVSEIVTSHSQA